MKLKTVLEALRNPGPFVSRARDRFYDWYYGVKTDGFYSPEELGISNPDSLHYSPIPYSLARRLLEKAKFTPHEDALLDYGCGLGRVLVLAAQYPFRDIIGVELSHELCEKARRNMAGLRRAQCKSAHIHEADALEFPVPDHVGVVFLFNSFRGETLRRVIGQVEQSIIRNPRPIQLLTANCGDLVESFTSGWLVRTLAEGDGPIGLSIFEGTGPRKHKIS